MDLALGLGALGGLRHSKACDDSQRSANRYDERQHRLHESRMKRLGMEGEESLEDEDMSQQVLIRSPTITHHHYEQPAPTPVSQPVQPAVAENSTLKKWLKGAAIAALPLAGIGGTLAYDAMTEPDTPSGYTDMVSDVEAVQLYKADE